MDVRIKAARRHTSATQTIAIAAVLAAATSVDAVIIKHTNPAPGESNHFPWTSDPYQQFPPQHLDLRFKHWNQPNTEVLGTTFKTSFVVTGAETPGEVWDIPPEQGWSDISGGTGISAFIAPLDEPWNQPYALAMRAGDSLGPTSLLATSVYLSRDHPTTQEPDDPSGEPVIHWGFDYTPFADGAYTLGVRFHNPDTNANHYGWITVELDATAFPMSSGSISFTEVVWLKSWAWETEPETPIVIPAPAGAAALALGALVAAPPRRRRSKRASARSCLTAPLFGA